MSAAASQLQLIPEKPPEIWHGTVRLDELPPSAALVGPPPSRELIESVRRFGIIDHIVIASDGNGFADGVPVPSWAVIDGRRRIKAARLAGWADTRRLTTTFIKSRDVRADVVTLMAHATRRVNPWSDLDAIERLLAQGASRLDITQATGLQPQIIKRRMRLLGLLPELRVAGSAGRISVAVAEEVARLPHERQLELLEHLESGEPVRRNDVERLRQARATAAVAALPLDAIMGTPASAAAASGAADIDLGDVRQLLGQIHAGLGGRGRKPGWATPDVIARIETLLAMLPGTEVDR